MRFPNKAIDGDAFLQEYKKVASAYTSLVNLVAEIIQKAPVDGCKIAYEQVGERLHLFEWFLDLCRIAGAGSVEAVRCFSALELLLSKLRNRLSIHLPACHFLKVLAIFPVPNYMIQALFVR